MTTAMIERAENGYLLILDNQETKKRKVVLVPDAALGAQTDQEQATISAVKTIMGIEV